MSTITSISISQDNKVDSSDLLAVHNPLVFIADVDWTGDVAPNSVDVNVFDATGTNLLDTFEALYYDDIDTYTNTNTRQFAFISEKILRAYMPDFDDVEQADNSLIRLPNICAQFTIQFISDSVHDEVVIMAIHACKQFGESPCLSDYNSNETYYCAKNNNLYVYYYCQNYESVTINGISDSGFRGIYRYKYTAITPQVTAPFIISGGYKFCAITPQVTVPFIISGGYKFCAIILNDFCTNDLLVKYLDHYGKYKFLSFNSYYEKKSAPVQIGKVSKFVTNIFSNKSDTRNVGYTNNQTITALADNISSGYRAQIADLFDSPRVYFMKNDIWILVEVKSSDNISKLKKQKFGQVIFDIILPSENTITMQ